MARETTDSADRRRVERRVNHRLADITLPEFRRMLITTILFTIVLVLFLWMVRTVIIATILAIVVAVYMRPVYRRVAAATGSPPTAAAFTLLLVIVPVFGLLIYSYVEIKDVAQYIQQNQNVIVQQIDAAARKLPFLDNVDSGETIRRYVLAVSNYGTEIPGTVRDALSGFAVAATIFMFTAFYVFVDSAAISGYFRSKIPPRYSELMAALEANVKGVLYGAIYSTVVTQTLKSGILFLLFLLFDVPLAAVLAIVAFIIGFFPIVGSWSVYVPVGLWLLVFRQSPAQAIALVAIGLFVNTIFISTYLRPKIAAEKSKVLNFYWMLVGLVTGVFTFGIVGVLLGPMVIGLLKAIIDTIFAASTWRLLDDDEVAASTTAERPA